MKKSLNINATRNGKKVSTSIGYVNPDVANSIAGGFAQMVNALTTNTFVNAEVVKKMDTTEEEQQSGGGSGKTEGVILVNGIKDEHGIWYRDETNTITSNSGQNIFFCQTSSFDVTQVMKSGTIPSGGTLSTTGSDELSHFYLFAKPTNDFTAATYDFNVDD